MVEWRVDEMVLIAADMLVENSAESMVAVRDAGMAVWMVVPRVANWEMLLERNQVVAMDERKAVKTAGKLDWRKAERWVVKMVEKTAEKMAG